MIDAEQLIKELRFKAIRSSGAGGQHVNKVSSKIELTFDISNSQSLTEEEKVLLYKNLHNRLTKDKLIIIFSDKSRSQHKNKEIAIERFLDLITKGLIKPKRRKATKPTKASVKKRLESKKKLSEKKSSRKKPGID